MAQPLLTPTSVALSLSPPRFPPHYRHHNHDPQQHSKDHGENSDYESHTLTSRILQLVAPLTNFRALRNNLQHPHLPSSLSLPDQLTRFLGVALPLETQHALRDDGVFRRIADGAVKLSCPMIGLGHWEQAKEFLELSRTPESPHSNNQIVHRGRRRKRWRRKRISYGDHAMQYFDLFLPTMKRQPDDDGPNDNKTLVRGTLFFVHGGAWGSGQPWMYRLVAPAFLKLNFAVVIVGYRTYPDAPTIDDQCGDVRLAWEKCEGVLNDLIMPTGNSHTNEKDDGWVGNIVSGHSSGAHVALLMLVDIIGEQAANFSPEKHFPATNIHDDKKHPWVADYFVGLSGPYDISYHFDYEAGRGVEQISPMKPICGHTREAFHKASPVKRLLSLMRNQREEKLAIQQLFPPTLLVHGIEDSTVPFTATTDAALLLRSCGLKQCDEIYLDNTSHQEVIMHFMLGGPAKDLVLEWLGQCNRKKKIAQIQSRL